MGSLFQTGQRRQGLGSAWGSSTLPLAPCTQDRAGAPTVDRCKGDASGWIHLYACNPHLKPRPSLIKFDISSRLREHLLSQFWLWGEFLALPCFSTLWCWGSDCLCQTHIPIFKSHPAYFSSSRHLLLVQRSRPSTPRPWHRWSKAEASRTSPGHTPSRSRPTNPAYTLSICPPRSRPALSSDGRSRSRLLFRSRSDCSHRHCVAGATPRRSCRGCWPPWCSPVPSEPSTSVLRESGRRDNVCAHNARISARRRPESRKRHMADSYCLRCAGCLQERDGRGCLLVFSQLYRLNVLEDGSGQARLDIVSWLFKLHGRQIFVKSSSQPVSDASPVFQFPRPAHRQRHVVAPWQVSWRNCSKHARCQISLATQISRLNEAVRQDSLGRDSIDTSHRPRCSAKVLAGPVGSPYKPAPQDHARAS